MQANTKLSLRLITVVTAALLATAASPPARAPAKHTLAAVQLQTTYAVDWTVRVNGFDLGPLPSMAGEANHDGELVRGFTSSGGFLEYTVVHPYFLKPGDNTLAIRAWRKPNYDDDAGAKSFAARAVAVEWDPAVDDQYSTEWPSKELVKIALAPMLRADKAAKEATAKLPWAAPSLPVWSWTKGTKIADDAKTKDSLYAAAQKFWQQLSALPSAPPKDRTALAASLRASTKEYVQACEIDGPKVHYVDDLVAIAATRELPGSPSKAERKKAAAADLKDRGKKPVAHVDDEPPHPDPAIYDNPHLTLAPLAPASAFTLEVFGDGALARLKSDADGLITYFSNYPDGQWGRTGEQFVKADVWFRKNAAGEWEVDAVLDVHMARLGMHNDPLKDLLEVQYPK